MGNRSAMSMKTRRITANLPEALLKDAQKVSGQGITETLVAGLAALVRRNSITKLEGLKGKIQLGPDRGRKSDPNRN
jgi:hypothetical protein